MTDLKFGELDSEKVAKEKLVCRQILHEINNFGINERQRLFLIYLLSLEIENTLACSDLTTVAKTLCSEAGGMLSNDE